MQKKLIHLVLLLVLAATVNAGNHVHKYVLDNGLTTLIRPVNTTQKVSTQLWVNVGSKHEADDEKGLAHWLEHMCFKGTQKMSETDIRLTVAKLSGGFNATTSTDWTRFYLNFPTQHCDEALPILADIMCNCTFKQDLLNAELQVVIQEMKNNRDNFGRQLAKSMMTSIFPDHPYHYPTIGYRSDLETLSRDKLMAFYQKHYVPNNAILVIVGNVEPDEVIKKVKKQFGHIEPDWSHQHKEYSCQEDICSKNVTLYRPIQKPHVMLAFRIPGAKVSNSISLDVLQTALAGGQDSRLYKKLVDQEKLVKGISIFSIDLYDHDLLIISFEPHELETMPIITARIRDEITALAHDGPELDEIKKAVKMIESGFYDLMEQNHSQASTIAKMYLATHNEDFLFEYIHHDYETIAQEVKKFATDYLRNTVMHSGMLLPLPEQEHGVWQRLQDKSNLADALLLQNKMRQSPVEAGKYVHTITAQEPTAHDIPVAKKLTLSNGLKVLYYHNDNLPKVQVGLNLKFDGWYEPQDKPPLCRLLNSMLLEGTTNRNKEQLMQEFDTNGISLSIETGSFSVNALHEHIHKAFELLTDVICNPLFTEESLEKHKKHALSDYTHFWDSPKSIIQYKINQELNNEFFHDPVGTPETIASITTEDLKTFHANYYSPHEATLVIVGDLTNINLQELLESTLGTWQGPVVEDRKQFNDASIKGGKEITHSINREQIMLAIAGLSVNRFHKDYYPLVLFDLVFTNKLFSLREQTNAFYWIHGSVAAGADKELGCVFIKTQVSQTRAQEAQELIMTIVDHIADTFDRQDLIEAQNNLINRISSNYSTNGSIGSTFMFLDTYNYPADYLVSRIPAIKEITVEQVRAAVKRVLNKENLSVFKVGSL